MITVESSATIIDDLDGEALLRRLEAAGRTCYKSEAQMTPDSAAAFVRSMLEKGHESVIEHEKVSVRIVCDRGVSHEIVRHRIGSYSQESTRYCDYTAEKHGQEIVCVVPTYFKDRPALLHTWTRAMEDSERAYFELREKGAKTDHARSVLPTSLKTEIVVTYNMREWRYFLKLRTSSAAHPQMREIAMRILALFHERVPVLFEDIVADPT